MESDNKIAFTVEKNVFPKIVLLRACYTFIDDYYIFLDETPKKKWIISVKVKAGSSPQQSSTFEGEFRNALIAEALREELTEKTKNVKELIVARALYGANSGGEVEDEFSDFTEEEMDDYLEDPLGIAIPWEEKHGKSEE